MYDSFGWTLVCMYLFWYHWIPWSATYYSQLAWVEMGGVIKYVQYVHFKRKLWLYFFWRFSNCQTVFRREEMRIVLSAFSAFLFFNFTVLRISSHFCSFFALFFVVWWKFYAFSKQKCPFENFAEYWNGQNSSTWWIFFENFIFSGSGYLSNDLVQILQFFP